MNLKKIINLSGLVMVMLATAQIIFAQDEMIAPVDQAGTVFNQQPTLQKENDIQWAWGEITNLDVQSNTITLKYLDYETDQEKDLVLVVDEKTTFENIKDFSELKLNDTLSVDYMLGEGNKNIAKNISFEKPDISSATSDVSEADALDLAQTITQPEELSEAPIVENTTVMPVESVAASVALESASPAQSQAQ